MKEHILTESGINLCDGSVITEGRILKAARGAKVMLEHQNYTEFSNLIVEAQKMMTDDEARILWKTVVSESGDTIADEMANILHNEADVPMIDDGEE